PAEHERFVLDKEGDTGEPIESTLLPAHRLVGRIKAEIGFLHATTSARAGEAFTDRLRIANAGSVTWSARGRRFGGQVTCGLKVCDADGEILREDLGRTALPRDVAPGSAIEIEMT